MVKYRRHLLPGGTFFFTVTLADRQSSALIENVAALRYAFRHVKVTRPFTIDAIVVLPDHLHVVMTLPAGDADFPARWQQIKGHFTRSVTARGVDSLRDRRGEYILWQRRFWEHTIRDDDDFERHVDYIHFNPVKHGCVSRVGDWPYSSFHRYVREGLLPGDWGGVVDQDAGNFGERTG